MLRLARAPIGFSLLGLIAVCSLASTPRGSIAADITWTNTGGGNWSNGADWNSGAGSVPGSGDVEYRPRVLPTKPTRSPVPPGYDPFHIEVKFLDSLQVRLGARGYPEAVAGQALRSAQAVSILEGLRNAGGSWLRAAGGDERRLDEMTRVAEANLGREIANLNNYYILKVPPGGDPVRILDELNALQDVEIAVSLPLPVRPPAPDFTGQQGYLTPPPDGIGADFAWSLAGYTGTGVTICVLEYSWNLNHSDLPAITTHVPPGRVASDPFNDDNHGTAVLGVLASQGNGFGTTGIAHGATVAVAPVYLDGVWAVAAALTHVTSLLVAGDVILIEQQMAGPNHPALPCCATATCPVGTDCNFGLVPVEWNENIYNCVLVAIGNGIHVVEAGGNGSQNLDDAVYNTGHRPFQPGNRSGAIFVGAGAAPATAGGSSTDRSRLGFSNYGSRFDLQGWGERVTTTGYGNLHGGKGNNLLYTHSFGGTSSAAPTVAGAVALLADYHSWAPLSPAELLTVLITTGSPQQSGTHPVGEHIGPRPDLVAAMGYIRVDARELVQPPTTRNTAFRIRYLSHGLATNFRATNRVQYFELDQGSYIFEDGSAPVVPNALSVRFDVDATGHIAYDPAREGLLKGAGTSTLQVRGYPITIDARASGHVSFDHTFTNCLDASVTHTLRLLPVASCCVNFVSWCDERECGEEWLIQFGVDVSGNVTYDPVFEGGFQGAGTNTLVWGPTMLRDDDQTWSMGKFRIVVEPRFWEMMTGYPGYNVVRGVHRLVSPVLLDQQTLIGRSSLHHDQSNQDTKGTPVGTAGTVISDASFTHVPSGFRGPPGTREIHTEVRRLNMTDGMVTVRAGTAAPSRPISPGEVQSKAGSRVFFPAHSFFNIFVEVDLPLLGGNPSVTTLHNAAPLLVQNDDLNCFPPHVVYIHRVTGPVPIVFNSDDPSGSARWRANDRLGWLVLAGHGVFGRSAAHAPGGAVTAAAVLDFEKYIDSQPEMADMATTNVDVLDVLTHSDDSVFVQPQFRDSLLKGLDAASALIQSGEYCDALLLVARLYQRVDGKEWVRDTSVAGVLLAKYRTLSELLVELGGCTTPVGELPPVELLSSIRIRPNPSSGAITFDCRIATEGLVKLEILDLSGRRVKTVMDRKMPVGLHTATWSGRGADGALVGNGIYFARLTVNGVTRVDRLVILR